MKLVVNDAADVNVIVILVAQEGCLDTSLTQPAAYDISEVIILTPERAGPFGV